MLTPCNALLYSLKRLQEAFAFFGGRSIFFGQSHFCTRTVENGQVHKHFFLDLTVLGKKCKFGQKKTATTGKRRVVLESPEWIEYGKTLHFNVSTSI